MFYIDIFLPLAISIMALSIPQLLIKEDHPRLEKKVILWRRIGYGLIAATIIYGIIKYLV